MPITRVSSEGIYLSIKLQPRSSRNEIGVVQGDELKVKVTAPPVDAAANNALIALLAGTLDCPKSAVQLVRGQTSRHKTLLITGMTEQEVTARLRTS